MKLGSRSNILEVGRIQFGVDKLTLSDVNVRKVRNVKKLDVAVARPIFIDYGKDTEQLELKGRLEATDDEVEAVGELADNSKMQPVAVVLPVNKANDGDYVVKEVKLAAIAGTEKYYEVFFSLWRVGGKYAKYYNVMQMIEEES